MQRTRGGGGGGSFTPGRGHCSYANMWANWRTWMMRLLYLGLILLGTQ